MEWLRKKPTRSAGRPVHAECNRLAEVPRCIQPVRCRPQGCPPVVGAVRIGVGGPGPQLFTGVAAEEPPRSVISPVRSSGATTSAFARIRETVAPRRKAGQRPAGSRHCRNHTQHRNRWPVSRRSVSRGAVMRWVVSGGAVMRWVVSGGAVMRWVVSGGAVMRWVVSGGAVIRQPVSRRGRRPPIHQPRRTLPAHGIAVCQRPRQPAQHRNHHQPTNHRSIASGTVDTTTV